MQTTGARLGDYKHCKKPQGTTRDLENTTMDLEKTTMDHKGSQGTTKCFPGPLRSLAVFIATGAA